jgi:hypothetical protein
MPKKMVGMLTNVLSLLLRDTGDANKKPSPQVRGGFSLTCFLQNYACTAAFGWVLPLPAYRLLPAILKILLLKLDIENLKIKIFCNRI